MPAKNKPAPRPPVIKPSVPRRRESRAMRLQTGNVLDHPIRNHFWWRQASWHLRTIEYRDARAPQIQPAANDLRGYMPKSKHRKNAPARPHHPRPKAIYPQASKMTHHDSPPGDDNPRMTQNDSLFQASNPEMTRNDSLFQASMPQMTQNDSHFEVFSFEMTQNDSFPGLKCPTEHPLSVAAEPPATPPSPQNDTPEGDPSAAGHPFDAGPLCLGHFACRYVLPSMTCHPERSKESHPQQGDPSLC